MCEKRCFCFEMKILHFLGIPSEVSSIVEVTKYVQPKVLDREMLQLWTSQAPIFLFAPTNWYPSSDGTVSSFTRCLPVGCSYSIFICPGTHWSLTIHNNSTRTAAGLIPNTLRWNAPMFYHLWCRTNATLMRTSANNHLFSSNCTTLMIDVHPSWLEENILNVLHIVPLDLQFCHMQRHVGRHVNILHSHIHQRPLHTMDACTTISWWMRWQGIIS